MHVLPGDGQIVGRDGRNFEMVDPSGLVLAFQSGGVDLPVDYEHQNDKPEAKLHGPVRAAGWIKELRSQEDGIWGRVEWTATAAEMIGRKEYRYLSPSLLYHPKTRQIVKLKGAGLVHNPNLHLTALANQDDDMNPDTIPAKTTEKPATKPGQPGRFARLAEALKLAPDATEDEMLAALKDLLKPAGDPDPSKFVPLATVQAMLFERTCHLRPHPRNGLGKRSKTHCAAVICPLR
ncbi:MAG: phage protease [Pseudomonadota bacterium]